MRIKRELRTELNKEFAAAHKKIIQRAFSRDGNFNGHGHGYN